MPPLVSPRNDIWATTVEIPHWWRVTTQTWEVLLIGHAAREIFFKEQYPYVCSDTSSVWNFCARFSDVISPGNQWRNREMSAFFSQAIILIFLGVLWQLPTPSNSLLWPVYRLCGKSCHLVLPTLLLLYFWITGHIFANVTAEETSSVKQFFSFKNEEVNIKTSATISFFTSPPFFLLDFSIIPDFLLLR